MKTAISMPDEVFTEADRLAKRTRISRSELYTRAVESYVKMHRHQGVREKLNAVYGKESSALDAVAGRMQRLSLPKDTW